MISVDVFQYRTTTITEFGEHSLESVLLDLLQLQNEVHTKFNYIAFEVRRTSNNNGLIIEAGHYVGVAYGSIVKLQLFPKSSLNGVTLEHVLFMCLTGQTGEGFESRGDNESLLTNCVDGVGLSGANLFSVPYLECLTKISVNGFRHEYSREKKYSAGEIKGRLDLEKQLLEPRSEIFHTVATKKDIDTTENQTLKYTLNVLMNSGVLGNTNFESIALSIIKELCDVSDISRDELNFGSQSTVPDPLYEQALSIAGLIINGLDPSSLTSTVNPPSWVVDLNKVFERHVCVGLQTMHDYYPEVDKFGLAYQPHFSIGVSASVRSNRLEIMREDRYIEPDGTYPEDTDNERIIIDAKNKLNPNREGVLSIVNQDLYQISYYLQRLNSNHGILVFPSARPNKKIQRFSIDHSNHLVTQYSLPIVGTPSEILEKLLELAAYIHYSNLESQIHQKLVSNQHYTIANVNDEMNEMKIPRETQNQISKISSDRIRLRI
jgi:5-methylcytosine-specific restriction endonuclease McrBC regulatory subunit McrC